jgi:GT2 family glycosyltransferase
MKPKNLIIIVNYKTADLVIQGLNALVKLLQSSIQLIIIDNYSNDHSINSLKSSIADYDNIHLIIAEKNLGFAGANNLAIRTAIQMQFFPEFIWLLNPDTLIRDHALEPLLNFMNQHSEVGIVGSRLEELNGDVQCSAFRFHSILGELEQGLKLGILSKWLKNWQVPLPIANQPIRADWVAGASMLIRQQVFEQIGLFDEHYFLYFEETDFCLQAQKAGWSCWYIPESRVVHFAGSSTGVTNHTQKRRPRYWFESRRYYFLKNHGWWYLLLANLTWSIAFALFRIRQKIQNKPDHFPKSLLKDFIHFNFLDN